MSKMQINLFKQNRLVCKKGEPLPPSPAPEGARLSDKLRGDPFYYARFPKKQKTEKALDQIKKEQKRQELAKEIPDKVTQEKEKKWKKRINKEVYRGNEKLRDRYFESVKDAIEKLPKDKLYEFIFNHTPAGNNWYKKGEYKTWNQEFAELINPYLPEDLQTTSKQIQRHKYIAGGLQNYILQYFKPNNVFQAGRSKQMTNPFIYTDGKMGSYTISVMAEYWNHKYGEKSKKQQLGNGDLDDTYAGKRKNRKIYDKALVYLDRSMGRAPRLITATHDVQVATVLSVPKAPKKKLEILRNNIAVELASNNASQEAIFAFNKSYEKKFRSAMRPIIIEIRKEGRFAHGDPEVWAEIHNKMIASNAVYKAAFENRTPEEIIPATPEYLNYEEFQTLAAVDVEKKKTKLILSDNLKNGKEKEKTYNENHFVRKLMAKINQYDLDFDWWGADDTVSREDFSTKIYEMCMNLGLPTSTQLVDKTVDILRSKHAPSDNVDYSPAINPEQIVSNRRILKSIERALTKEYLTIGLPDEKNENLNRIEFVSELVMAIDDANFDFEYTGVLEDVARIQFAQEIHGILQNLGLPTSLAIIEETIAILRSDFIIKDSDIKYYPNPGNDKEELAANKKIISGIEESLLEKHKVLSDVILAKK